MWNFTGRGALVPNLTGIEYLFCREETCIQPQQPILELKATDVMIDNHLQHMKIWHESCDSYYLQLLQIGLNCIPQADKDFSAMAEEEFVDWLVEEARP